MSHFTVLVVGSDIEGQLAPYHEFECTGIDDQYVQEIDKTEEARESFHGKTETRYRNPEGVIVSQYGEDDNYTDEFLRDPTPEELAEHRKDPLGLCNKNDNIRWVMRDTFTPDGRYEEKIFCVPEGYTEVEVFTKDHETFAEWIEGYYGHKIVPYGTKPDFAKEHKYGYTIVDKNGEVVKTVDRTNPNAQWDWYQVGGRWNGFFKLKPAAIAAGAGVVGEPGLNRMDDGYKDPGEDRADSCVKGDVDIEGMRTEAGEYAAKAYDNFHAVLGDTPMESWAAVRAKYGIVVGGKDVPGELPGGIEAARNAYNSQPAVALIRADERTNRLWETDEYLGTTREQYIQSAKDAALSTFAFVKDGQWIERGDMGWFGRVSDEQDMDVWSKKFAEMLDTLPDDTLLTVVDCHI